jgi:hypothetical protein
MALFKLNETTAEGKRITKPWPWTYWLALAVCLILLAGAVFAVYMAVKGGGQIKPPPPIETPVVTATTATTTEATTTPTTTTPTTETITTTTATTTETTPIDPNASLTVEYLEKMVDKKLTGQLGDFKIFAPAGRIVSIVGQVITISQKDGNLSIYIGPEVPIIQRGGGQTIITKLGVWAGLTILDIKDLQPGKMAQICLFVTDDSAIEVGSVLYRYDELR